MNKLLVVMIQITGTAKENMQAGGSLNELGEGRNTIHKMVGILRGRRL